MKNKAELTYHQVRHAFHHSMGAQIDLQTQPTKCTQRQVWDILGLAAVRQQSVAGTCDNLADAPTSPAVFYQLRQGFLNLHDLNELEAQMGDLLLRQVPPEMLQGWHEVAFDFTEIPYHGCAHSDEEEIRRSKAKSGTTSFHIYASAYLITRNKRLTVAIAYWQAGQSVWDVFNRLMTRLQALPVRVKRLLLDRQFCNVAVVRYLEAQPFQSIMPVPARSKALKEIVDTTQRSYQTSYTMQSPQNGSVTMPLYVVGSYLNGRYGKHGHEIHLFTVLGRPWRGSLQRLGRKYRFRFGIESSYRQMNRLRIRTTSQDPAIRFLFVTIAFLLFNLWRVLNWQHLAIPRKGGRYLDESLFRLQTFMNFLADAICEICQPVRAVSRPELCFLKY